MVFLWDGSTLAVSCTLPHISAGAEAPRTRCLCPLSNLEAPVVSQLWPGGAACFLFINWNWSGASAVLWLRQLNITYTAHDEQPPRRVSGPS